MQTERRDCAEICQVTSVLTPHTFIGPPRSLKEIK